MAKKLHILFLCSWFPSRVRPTSGDFVQRHAEAVATKHKVTVIHAITDENLKSNFEICTCTENNVKIIIGYIRKFNNPIFKFFYFFLIYRKCLQKIAFFDLVHLNVTYPKGIVALYLKWFKKKPYIITEHWTDYQYPLNKHINTIRKKITQIITANSEYVCPVNNKLKISMKAFGLKGEYISIPNVVDTALFKISKNKNRTFTITHISHMGNEHKNVAGIIRVISKVQEKIPTLIFNLIGENSFKFKELIDDLKIKNTNIIDQIPNTEVPNYFNKSDVFVLFSNYENLPCVVLEAFSCGVPVISTNVGGISEYFPNNFGYLINVANEKELECKLLEISNSNSIASPEEMHSYAEQKFGIETISNSFSNLYFKSLKK